MTGIFKAIADETRLRIILILLRADKELCICDLMDILELPQYTISRHMKELKNAGLASGKRRGKFVYYRQTFKNEPFFKKLKEALNSLEIYVQDNMKLERILEEKTMREHCK